MILYDSINLSNLPLYFYQYDKKICNKLMFSSIASQVCFLFLYLVYLSKLNYIDLLEITVLHSIRYIYKYIIIHPINPTHNPRHLSVIVFYSNSFKLNF